MNAVEKLLRDKAKIVYTESDAMIKKPKNYKRDSDNLPDMKKVKQYYSQKKGK